MTGRLAVPTALMRLPRLTASHEVPVLPKMMTPASIASVTPVAPEGPRSLPTSTRPSSAYSTPGRRLSVVFTVRRAGSEQIRYVPVGPVSVPSSRSPAGSAMVGQPPAGVTWLAVGLAGGVTGVWAGG